MQKLRYIIQAELKPNTWHDLGHVESGTTWRSGTVERAERQLALWRGELENPPLFGDGTVLRIALVSMEMPDPYATSGTAEIVDDDDDDDAEPEVDAEPIFENEFPKY